MATTGLLSKGSKFYYGSIPASGSTVTYTEVKNVQSIPSLGGEKEKIETTCLENENKTYINGLIDYGELEFGFLYAVDENGDSTNYATMRGIEDQLKAFKVELPDGSTFEFNGTAASSIDEVGVNAALTFTTTIALASDITYTA